MTLPASRPDPSLPEPANDPKPADGLLGSELADRIRTDGWRRNLNAIRGEILEIAAQGSRQGLADVARETVALAQTLEQLETLLGLAEE